MILFTLSANAQNNCTFRTLKPKKTVTYATNVPLINYRTGEIVPVIPVLRPKVTVNPKMDIYEPNLYTGESPSTKFPLVIICHGANTSRVNTPWTVQSIATEMAKRGFITCVIDYRNDFELVMSENLGLFFFDYYANMAGLDSTMSCNEILHKKYTERVFYSNAMDVQNAITYMVNNQSSYKVNTSKVVVGGHSQGGMVTTYSLYVDKDEMTSNFPATFMTDSRYIDLNLHRSKIKCGFSLGGGISNINYIDSDENIPIFMAHGTHDEKAPYHIGYQFCQKLDNSGLLYGSAAIAEKLDAFPDNLGFSYYLVQLNGIGHNPFVTSGNLASSFTVDFWQDDFFRYIYNSLFPPPNNYKNQIHKIVTPNNSIFNYCDKAYVEEAFYFSNYSSSTQTSPCGKPFYSCLNLHTPTLTTKPWIDHHINFCTNLLDPVNFNTNSNDTCILDLTGECLTFNGITICLEDNYSFMRKNKNGINDITEEKNIQKGSINLYPNPASNVLNIEASTNEIIETISIVNTSGNIVHKSAYNGDSEKRTIDVLNIASGNYVIQIQTNIGTYSNKIIIKH